MNVIHIDTRRIREINSATELGDDPLHELLRKTVVHWRRAHLPKAKAHMSRSNLSTAYTYMDAIAIVLGKEGIPAELSLRLAAGVFDIRKLARAAREWSGPAGA
ncbi:hypothetical protein HTS88_21015 [Pseudarthrobacter oxydans]|uniref:hypothetical protein n=1 Tax=Pseudarthrobacter oxydans TaxID=1671 RepID=UPI0015716235|nr:hypothetical protein [Pseudarthrobacter oxydans]NSX38863.1 hypothetical protein [Pseudarthrobacter oxydans]